jgi:quinol monooxygenase YgiN
MEHAYTLAMYRVKPGHESAFIAAWNELANTFSSLSNPPIWGTLIRHRVDSTLFYSFGPWRGHEHVEAMRADPRAQRAFRKLSESCSEIAPGDYEVVRHVDVQRSVAHA